MTSAASPLPSSDRDAMRLENLRRAITSIESRLGDLASDRHAKPQRAASPDFEPAAQAKGDSTFGRIAGQMSSLRGEITDRRTGEKNVAQDAFNKAAFELQQGINNAAAREGRHQSLIARRLQQLGESLVEVESAAFSSRQRQERVFSEKLDDIRQTMGSLPEARSINRLEGRLDIVQSKIEQLSQAADASIIAQQRLLEEHQNGVVREDLSQIESRLDEIARAVVAASSVGIFEEAPPKIDLPAIDRIEAQVAELSRTVDRIADVQDESLGHPMPDISGLESQLTQLSSRFDALLAKPAGNDTLSQLEEQIRLLADQLGNQHDIAVETIETQMRELARAVEQVGNDQLASADLGGLYERLADITKAVNAQEKPADTSDMRALVSDLEGRIAKTCAAAAVDAAQAAVDRVLETRGDDQTILALSRDLKVLREFAESDSKQTTRIADTLNLLTDRLATIEAQNSATDQIATPEVEVEPGADTPAESNATPDDDSHETGAGSDIPELSATPVADASVFANESSTVEELEEAYQNDELLEPGTAPSDVVDEVVEREAEFAPEIRPDAIAAARRALQATTDEVAAIAADEARPRLSRHDRRAAKTARKAKSRSGWHRPILVAAAAVLLALSAYQGYQLVDGAEPGRSASVAKPDSNIANDETVPAPPDVKSAAKVTVVAPQNTPAVEAKPIQLGVTTLPQGAVPIDDKPEAPLDPVVTGTVEREMFDLPATIGTATFVAAANAGNPRALYELGTRYSNGEGVDKDLEEAAKWMRKSAELGFAPAQYSYASMLQTGIGLEPDLPQAARWYGKAATQGNVRSIHNLAFLAARAARPGENDDMEKARIWFERAANFGLKDSQFNLGILYGRGGRGIEKDLVAAYKWFAIAGSTGDASALAKRDEIAAQLSQTELETARKLAEQWRPAKLDEDANSIAIPEAWKGAASSDPALEPDVVKEVQLILNRKGFAVGTPDGVMGERTISAIKQFQRSAGIPATGKVDERLMRALRA